MDQQDINDEFLFYTEHPGNEKLISAISILFPPPGSQATLASFYLPIFRVGRSTDAINLRNDTLCLLTCWSTYPLTLPPLNVSQ